MKNLIIPNLAKSTLEEVFKKHLDDVNTNFQKNRQMLLDFYLSQQTDLDSYLKDYFKKTTVEGGSAYPHNLILTQTNITSKVIDQKAKCYLQQPVRSIDGNADEDYTRLLIDGGIKSTSKQMDIFTWLLGDVCTIFIADAKKKKLKFLNPPYYIPLFDKSDNIYPIAVLYPCGLVDEEGMSVEGWVYWDEEKYILYNSKWEIIEEKENEHRVFNAIFTHRIKPFLGHYTKDAQDLVDTNRDINVALTAINNAFRYVGFPVWAAIGIKEPKEGDKPVQISFDRLVKIYESLEGRSGDFKVISPNVNWTDLLTSIKMRCEFLSTTWNTQFEIVGSVNLSGLAIKILTKEHRDDLDSMKELYEEYFEVPLFEKLKVASQYIDWLKVKGNTLTLDWAEEEYYETPTDKLNRLKTEIELNLTTPIDELKDRNPDLDDEAAIAKYTSNAELNKRIRTGSITEEEAMDIILGKFEIEKAEEPPVAETIETNLEQQKEMSR